MSTLCAHKKHCTQFTDVCESDIESVKSSKEDLIGAKSSKEELIMQVLSENQGLRAMLSTQHDHMVEQSEARKVESELISQLKEQQEQIKEQQKQMAALIPKVGTTTHQDNRRFNIQLFLNETCKDAVNWHDFVGGLQVGVDECAAASHVAFFFFPWRDAWVLRRRPGALDNVDRGRGI